MKSLAAALEAHQEGARRVPSLEASALAERGGLPILTWSQWYAGAESDTASAVAVSATTGTLHRVNNRSGNAYYSRVTSPTSGSTFSSWTSLGTDIVGNTGIAVACFESTVLVMWVKTGSRRLRWRRSTDDGATFSAAADMVASDEASNINNVACALVDGSNGYAFYNATTTLRRCPFTTGAWGTRATATPTFTSIAESGMSAIYSPTTGRYYLAMTGQEASTSTWFIAVYAMTGTTWTGPVYPFSSPSTATVSFIRHASVAEVVQDSAVTLICSWTEREAGLESYDRTFIARGLWGREHHIQDAGSSWQEPEPTDITRAYGGRLAHDGNGRWYLVAANAVYAADAVHDPGDGTDISDRVISCRFTIGDAEAFGELTLDDADGAYAAGSIPALTPGGELNLRAGYSVAGTPTYGTDWRLRVMDITHRLAKGRRELIVSVAGPWEWLQGIRTRQGRQITAIARRTTARQAASKAGYRFDESEAPSTFTSSHQPAFLVEPGTSWSTILRAVTAPEDVIQVLDGRTIDARRIQLADTADATFGSDHATYELEIHDRVRATNWTRVQGTGRYFDAFDMNEVSRGGPRMTVTREWDATSSTKSGEYATTLLQRARNSEVLARAVVPWHAGLEPGDVVTITDARLRSASLTARVSRMQLVYERGPASARYDAILTLTRR